MPLVAYLKTSDRSRISSVSTLQHGIDRQRHKRISPINSSAGHPQLHMYVRDCYSHDPVGVVVPVDLMEIVDGRWEFIGVAKCCPLCWMIIIPPDGVELPDPTPLPEPTHKASLAQRAALAKGRVTQRKNRGRPKSSQLYAQVMDIAEAGDNFTVQDIMELSNKSRTAVRKVFTSLVSSGELVISSSGGLGKGNSTLYKKAP